jgi:hypothetical protein
MGQCFTTACPTGRWSSNTHLFRRDGLMDLLEHYDSSSSDGDDKNQSHQTKIVLPALPPIMTTMRRLPPQERPSKRGRGSVTIVSDRGLFRNHSLYERNLTSGATGRGVFVRIPISATATTTVTEESDSSSSEDRSAPLGSRSCRDSAMFRNDLERAGYTGTLVQHEHCHLSLSRPFYLQVADRLLCR